MMNPGLPAQPFRSLFLLLALLLGAGGLQAQSILPSPTVQAPLRQAESPAGGENPKAEVSLSSGAVTLTEEGRGRFSVMYTFPEGFHQTLQEEFFTVRSTESSPFPVLEVIYPEGGVEEEGVLNYYESVELRVEIGMIEDITPGEYRVPFTAEYQLCDEAGTCFFPESTTLEMVVTVPEGLETNNGVFMLLQFLLFAFLGGLLLNVMPCVLPVLSIRALNLVRQSNNNRREIFVGSLFYTLGVILSLLILAAVVIVLKISGELVGWGFQFQNPLFTVFLIVVVFTFALSLFDVYVFQAPVMNSAVKRAGQKGYVGSFFNGIIAVLLATPCTAPLLGTALGFAFSQTPLIILIIFTMVGLGFAFPFLLIGIRPSVIQKIPKPGPWMNTFKELMGFILLATALYLFSILRYQLKGDEILRVFYFLLILGFLLWGYGKTAKPTSNTKRKWIILALLLILSGISAAQLLQFGDQSNTTESGVTLDQGWERFSPEILEQYRAEKKPVLVIFSAKWCTVCKLNEQTVLKTDRAAELFKNSGTRVLYGDFTNRDPVIEEWIRFYERGGVPVYAFYPPGASHTLLPEVLSFQILEERLGSF